MAGRVRIGFSMHPRWTGERGLEDFLRPLRQVGLSALEFELDDRLEDWPAFGPLMKASFEMGLALSFHAPYRQPHSLVGFAGNGRAHIQADVSPLLAVAETWAQLSPTCRRVVVHAAVGRAPADPAALAADTHAFLAWVLEAYPDLELALENNHPARPGEVKAGVAPQDVLALIAAVDNPRLNACWDLGHDFLRAGGAEPSAAWLAKVVHVHVHDINEIGVDHYPLVFGNVPVEAWLRAWKAQGGRGGAVLELKGKQLMGWSADKIGESLELSVATLGEVLV
jgi:sugar phosphate isomerase/epimerase